MCSGVFANNLSDGIIWWHLLVKQYQLFRIALFKGNILYISHRIFVWFFFRSGRFRTMKCSWCMHKWNYVCQQQFYALKWMILLKLSHFQATARERERKRAEFFRLCNRWVQCASFKHHFASELKYIYGNTGNGKIVMQNHRISYWKKINFTCLCFPYARLNTIAWNSFWETDFDSHRKINQMVWIQIRMVKLWFTFISLLSWVQHGIHLISVFLNPVQHTEISQRFCLSNLGYSH